MKNLIIFNSLKVCPWKLILLSALILFVSQAECQITTYTVINPQQEQYECIIGMVIDQSKINGRNVTGEINTPSAPYENLTEYDNSEQRTVFSYSRIAIRFYDKQTNTLTKINNVGLKKITIRIGTVNKKDYTLTPTDKLITDFYINVNELVSEVDANGKNVYDFNPNDKVYLDIEFDNVPNKTIIVPTFSGIYRKFISTYNGLNSKTGGFWVPLFLFSSNLKTNENGVPFAALPIGLAWGIKFNSLSQKKSYIGVSVMGNWLIKNQSEADGDFIKSNNWSLNGATTGVLIDVNDVVYLGYAYGFDFRKGQANPGNMLVVGFGSKAIDFLKSKKN